MELQVFKNNQFGEVRTVNKNGEPWFIAKDVCEILGYSNPRDAIIKHVDEEEKGVVKCDTLGGLQNLVSINESGLYSLIFGSKLKTAKQFRKWVTSEVLPSIRQNGGYIVNQENLNEEELLAKALVVAQRVIENNNKKIEQLKPKAEFYDAVAGSKDAIDIGTVAKVLAIRGLGRNKLFEKLREVKVLMTNNQPYQKFIDSGYFRIIEQKYNKPDGSTSINIKTLVYQKGLDFIRKVVQG